MLATSTSASYRILSVEQQTAKLTFVDDLNFCDSYRVPALNARYRPTPVIAESEMAPDWPAGISYQSRHSKSLAFGQQIGHT